MPCGIATLTTASNVQPFMASSPPAWDANMHTPQHITSPLALAHESQMSSVVSQPLSPRIAPETIIRAQPNDPTVPPSPSESKDNYVSKISILASSLPFYHNQFMEQQKQSREAERQRKASRQVQASGSDLDSNETAPLTPQALEPNPRLQSPEEQAETVRRLKPKSLSSLQLQHITSQPLAHTTEENIKPEVKKHRTRWQFGIRSRNLPHEAIHCVYKALLSQGAEWEIPPPEEKEPTDPPKSYPVHVHGATRINETIHPSRAPSPEHGKSAYRRDNQSGGDYMYNFDFDGTKENDEGDGRRSQNMVSGPGSDSGETDDEDIDPGLNPPDYIPKDPWCIRVRWRKDGMLSAGGLNQSSANSSLQDLNYDTSRRPSMIGSLKSAAASSTSVATISDLGPLQASATGSCYVYMDVQLYTLEQGSEKQSGTYLVDFKCAGYETLLEKAISDSERVLAGSGYRIADKDVTSPQPFLDLTNKLVIYLAGGGGG